MRNRRVILFLACFFLFFSLRGILPAQTLPYRQYNVTDGLASSFVTDIAQDRDGFLWVGTQRGLSRFDGVRFENTFSNKTLPSDYIEDLMIGPDGRIWLATHGGCVVFDVTEGILKQAQVLDQRHGLLNRRVCSIVRTPDGIVWLGTVKGVSRYNGKTFRNFTFGDDPKNNFVNDFAIGKNGDLWVGTSRGLNKLSHGEPVRFESVEGLVDKQINVLMNDQKGMLWIGTQNGLFCYQIGGQLEICGETEGRAILSLMEDRRGNIWVGTRHHLLYFPPGDFPGKVDPYWFEVGQVSTVFEDKEGNIWFGSSAGLRKIQFLRIVNFTTVDGLPSNLVWSILEDKAGRIWLGTGKGLSRMWQGQFKTFTATDGLGQGSVYALDKDNQGRLWIGTSSGLSVYSSGRFRNFTTKHGLPDRVVISLMADSRGGVWVGTVGGMCRWNGRSFDLPSFPSSGSAVHCFLETRDGYFWFCDTRGVSRVASPLDKTKSTVKFYSIGEDPLYSFVTSLYQDSKNRIWMTSRQGVSCLENETFTHFTTADGLSDNACYFILEDNIGNLWIGTGRGVCRYNGRSFKSYSVWDGLTSYEMNQGACLKDSEGHLWFGTVNGVTRFDPLLDPVNPVPPPVYISRFHVHGESYPFRRPSGDQVQAVLEHNRNYIQIGFVGVSLTSPESVEYRYRLDPIDTKWVTTRERNAGFPYLPPGDYRFKVRAVNSDGIGSQKAAELRFRILPPFWKTWWFQLLSIISVVSVAVMFFFWRMRRTREKIELRERNKQLIMSQKMELLGVLAAGTIHDLKNLLAVIIAYSKIAAKQLGDENGEEKDSPLDRIKTTAVTAVQVVKQILAFTRQGSGKTMSANLPDLVDDIVSILKVTSHESVTIVWHPPAREIRFSVNPTRFQQVMMNLCLNAIHAMPRGGVLTIGLDEQPGRIIFTVTDTGEGMADEIRSRIFEPLFTTKAPGKGTGLGLFVVKQIVEEYRGIIDVRSVPGEGTAFTIIFPKNTRGTGER